MDHANPLDTHTDHSTLIKAISWLAVVTSFFFLSLRMGMKWANTRSIGLDDFAIVLALLLSTGASICLTIAANQGYGNRDVVPDDRTLILIQKVSFAVVLCMLQLTSVHSSSLPLIFYSS